MTRILVTGANGHVGTNTVRSLLKRNYEVVPFVRTTSDLRGLAPMNLTYAYGDVMDKDSLLAAAEGCDAIIHTAAVYQYWAKDPDDIMKPALVGTNNVFNVAKEMGIERVIYTSSVWAIGLSTDPNVVLTVKDWNTASLNPYAVAKTKAEKEAWKLSEELGVPMISICPNGIFGPYNYRLTPSSIILRDIINGTQITFEAGFAFIDARDVGEIHALAVTEGELGNRYITSGENLSVRKLGELIGKLTGYTPRYMGLGRTSFSLMAGMAELAGKMTNSEPMLTRAFVHDTVQRYMYTNCQDTWDTFNYQPRSLEVMLSDAIRWLLYIGEIKEDRASAIANDFPPLPEWVSA